MKGHRQQSLIGLLPGYKGDPHPTAAIPMALSHRAQRRCGALFHYQFGRLNMLRIWIIAQLPGAESPVGPMAAPAANSAGPGRRGAQALSAPRAKPEANACSDVIIVSNGYISSFANPSKQEYVCVTFLGRYPDVNTTRLQSTARIALVGAACLAFRCFGIPDTETDLVAAVSARVSDDYVRKSQADGRPQDEFYAFGEERGAG